MFIALAQRSETGSRWLKLEMETCFGWVDGTGTSTQSNIVMNGVFGSSLIARRRVS